MDDPLIAFLFAEELTHFVLAEHGFEMPTKSGVRKYKTRVSKSRFNSVIGDCVLDLISSNAGTIRSSYEKLQESGIQTFEAFRFEATISTIFHFREGYDPQLFLNLSAMLIGLAVLYFRDGIEDMAIGASQVLAYVLNFYIYQTDFCPSRGWFDMAVVSQYVRRSLDVNKNTVDVENNTIYVDKNTVDVDNNTIYVGGNTVDVENKTIYVDKKSVDVENNTIFADKNTVDIENNTICIDKNTVDVENNTICIDKNPVDVENSNICIDKNILNVEKDSYVYEDIIMF